MLKFCYLNHYRTWPCSPDSDTADQHLAMYRLGDLYDMPDLREYACSEILDRLSPYEESWHKIEVTDGIVLVVQKILGPDVDSFADNSIQKRVYFHVTRHVKLFYKNALFKALLADGSMFNEAFAQKFTDVVGEIINHTHGKFCDCYPTYTPPPASASAWDQPPAGISW